MAMKANQWVTVNTISESFWRQLVNYYDHDKWMIANTIGERSWTRSVDDSEDDKWYWSVDPRTFFRVSYVRSVDDPGQSVGPQYDQ